MIKILPASEMASLHNHSQYSLLDSTLTIEKLVSQARELGFKSVALTEHGHMFSYINFYKECKKQGIKPIIGCEVYETDNLYIKEAGQERYHLLLLAKNEIGLRNLMEIVTIGMTDGFYQKPRIDRDLLARKSEGLICTSSCLASRINRLLVNGFCQCCGMNNNEHKVDCDYDEIFEPKWEEAKKEIEIYKNIFGQDFYLELQSHRTYDQKLGNQRILKLSKEVGVKTIICFDSHMESGDSLTMDVHRTFIKISQDREVDSLYQDCFQQDMDYMYNILRDHMDEEDIDNSVRNVSELSDKCFLELELGTFKMPQMDTPKPFRNQMEYFRYLIDEGWKIRGIDKYSKKRQEIYRARIEEEIPVLEELGFINYYIMNYKLMQKIAEKGIPKGYARGSSAGSICSYLLFITDIDSIKWELDFSRFANLGRKGSVPDVDTDVSKYRRSEVIEIAEELFGKDRVAHVATFGTLSSKVAVRDLGRVFNDEKIYDIPYSIRDKIAKLIPEGLGIDEALNESGELKRYEKKYPLLFEYTRKLEGLPKSIGTHASAIAVSDRNLLELCPLMLSKEGRPMLQVEMNNMAEDLGIVKLDLLGLATLDIIDNTLKFTGLTWKDIDIDKLDLTDQKVFEEIYSKGNTKGIFQMESHTAQNLLRNLQPSHIEEIVSVNSLNRPALLSVGMDKIFIHNKHNPKDIKYIHLDLKPIFSKTKGVLLYQEQALACFRLANFPLDECDNARRAIGKKKKEVMEKLENKFFEGLLEKQTGWHVDQIAKLWELIVAQAEYSFNRSHAVAYALLSYVCAYLKAHYPREFMVSCLINAIGDYPETSSLIAEAKRMGLEVVNPHINLSQKEYTLGKKANEILFGFVSVKGIGESSVEIIIEARKSGKFKSFTDFLERTNVNSTTIISLIKAGAFGNNKEHKEKLLLNYAEMTADRKEYKPVKTLPKKGVLIEMLSIDENGWKDKEKCLELYNEYKRTHFNETQNKKVENHVKKFKEKYMHNHEMYEFETLSMFLNGNPYDKYSHYFKDWDEYGDGHEKMLLGGTISNVDRKKSKNGTAYAYIELLFPNGSIREGMAFSEVYTSNQDLIKVGTNVVMLAKKSGDQFIVSKMKSFPKWKLEIKLKEQQARSEKNDA